MNSKSSEANRRWSKNKGEIQRGDKQRGEQLMDDAHQAKLFNPSFACSHKRLFLPEVNAFK